jgi:hypothetical protein
VTIVPLLPATAGLQLVITDASWPLRGAFLEALSRCLDNLQCRAPWYPGSAGRIAAFKQGFPGAQALGVAVPAKGQAQGAIPAEPWQLVTGGCGAWVVGGACRCIEAQRHVVQALSMIGSMVYLRCVSNTYHASSRLSQRKHTNPKHVLRIYFVLFCCCRAVA